MIRGSNGGELRGSLWGTGVVAVVDNKEQISFLRSCSMIARSLYRFSPGMSYVQDLVVGSTAGSLGVCVGVGGQRRRGVEELSIVTPSTYETALYCTR